MAGLGMDTRPTEGTSARSDQGGPGSARPEGPEVVLTAPHLAGDTRIVREIVGKLDERTLGMGGALFSAEGGCALRRGSRQARRSCWAAGSRPRCPRAPGRGGGPGASFASAAQLAETPPSPAPSGDRAGFSSALPNPLPTSRWRASGGGGGNQRPPAVPGSWVEHLSLSLMLAPGWTKRF